ncbi:hypothetical protein CsSME_00024852 [Camellia sinensis var. sinensis]
MIAENDSKDGNNCMQSQYSILYFFDTSITVTFLYKNKMAGNENHLGWMDGSVFVNHNRANKHLNKLKGSLSKLPMTSLKFKYCVGCLIVLLYNHHVFTCIG